LTPQLLYGEWLDEMPNLKRLMEGSIKGNLVSTVPPITVPAWTAMMTSKDPGMLGFYGFRNRKSHEYEELYFANANAVKAKTVWNHLSRNRLRSILLGVPQTYPPKPLNGLMVSSFLTPNKDVTYTYPPELAGEIDRVADGDYIIDVENFRTNAKKELLEQIYTMTARRFKVYRHLIKNEDWDFAMMVEMGPDRIHHAFWRFCDPTHRLYEKGNEFENVIHDYYLYLDEEVGRTLDVLPPSTSVIVVSDHGAKPMHGGICINEFFIEQGLLALKEYPGEPKSLKPRMIDWKKTRVWGEGGYYARIFCNVQGREPEGVIPSGEFPAFLDELQEKLEAITDEKGECIGTKVFRPAEVYREVNNIAPDLIVYLGDLDWRSAGTVGQKRIHIFENDTGPDDANHAQEGIFVWSGRGKEAQGGRDENFKVSIYDVAPSILDFFSIDVPEDMIGRVL
jgi:predicted AlkP superfamily phosphohydrolase/phosphomutase